MSEKNRNKEQPIIFKDVERLSRIRSKLWAAQVDRLEEKTPYRGSYTVVPVDELIVNLNRNVGQFTVAIYHRFSINKDEYPEGFTDLTKKTVKQAADIVNLVSMILDNLNLSEDDYDLILGLKRT